MGHEDKILKRCEESLLESETILKDFHYKFCKNKQKDLTTMISKASQKVNTTWKDQTEGIDKS